MAKEKKPVATAAKKVTLAKGVKVKRGVEEKLRAKKGSSSVGRYKDVETKSFCGPAGGASKFSYPVNSAKRCRAALAYAHNAPNPEGIRKCVKAKCKGKVSEVGGKKLKK